METKDSKFAWAVILALLTPALAACDAGADRDRTEQGEQKVALGDVPPAVKATIDQESKGGELKEIDKLSQDGKAVYDADIVANGKEQRTLIGEDGTVIKRQAKKDDDDDD